MDLKKKVSALPTSSGVYIFRDTKKRIIYIGKAVNLRARVRSYFRDKGQGAKTQELVKSIAGLEHMKTDSEVEALILEAELIKRYKPKFNVVWKDDKNYLYIKISSEDYPQVSVVRQIVDDKARYIGPFVSAGAVRSLLRYTRKIFMFRHCEFDLNKGIDSRRSLSAEIPASAGMTKEGGNDGRRKVCLQYSIGNCLGPCEGYISKTEYRKSIRQMMKLFKGKTKEIEREFRREMKRAANAEDFEGAAMYRNRLVWLKKIKTIELGEEERELKSDKALTGLRDALSLGAVPKRIECYDISNIFGKAAVGSMVVFLDGIPDKDHYRRFEIKTVDKISDTDMIREVLTRRLSKLKIKNEKLKNERKRDSSTSLRMTGKVDPTTPRLRGASKSFAQIPDLIIIDGGKGQLSAALSVVQTYKLRLNVVSLAKRHEEIHIMDKNGFKKVKLPEGSESLYLVQRIRDEAHRFAITYHRSKRGKEMATSNLDTISGVGPKTKKELLKSFGSVDNIKKANFKDLSETVGEKLARKIKEGL